MNSTDTTKTTTKKAAKTKKTKDTTKDDHQGELTFVFHNWERRVAARSSKPTRPSSCLFASSLL